MGLSMKLALALVLAVGLAPSAGAAQRGTAADRAWRPFFAAFRAAVKRRDEAAMRRMMSRDFYYLSSGGDENGNHDTRDEAFDYWEATEIRALDAFDRVLAQGAVPNTSIRDPGNRRPSRVAPPVANDKQARQRGEVEWYAVFEFRRGRWYCIAFLQCCD